MSRLEDSGNILREQIISRNLYTPTDIYDINNPRIIDAVNSISRLLRPGNGFDFSNTVIGRVVGPQTPITEIGRLALINLYTEQVKSTIVKKTVPTININNIFNNKPVFSKNIDYSITKQDPNNILLSIFNTIKDFSGVNDLSNPIKYNTERITSNFDKTWIYNTTELSMDLLKRYTGNAQKNHLELLLSNNTFSNDISGILSVNNSMLISNLIPTKSIISTIGNNFNLFSIFSFTNLVSYYQNRYTSKFYATTGDTINQQDIDRVFGKSYFIKDKFKNIELSQDIVTTNQNDLFTWGIDNTNVRQSKGLLGYTNAIFNILNERGNAPFNKTVESINVNGENYYNGIRFGETDENGNIVKSRSYSITNQMDGISKTIKPYGYSEKSLNETQLDRRKNSPLYKRPIPKILFTNFLNDNKVNNDVMFSIENLAYSTDDIIDVYEKGPNNGRILWFSPTIIDFNEDTTPNIISTNFLGRSEPVYTYANTERKLSINFFMVVDHANDITDVTTFEEFQDRLYNLKKQSQTSQKQSIDGIPLQTNNLIEKTKKEVQNNILLNEIEDLTKIEIPFNNEDFIEIPFYFPNDVFNVQTTITQGYEITGLNSMFDINLNNLLLKIKNYQKNNPDAEFTIEIKGYTSALGNATYNQELSEKRANSLIEYIKKYINEINDNFLNKNLNNIIDFIKVEGFGETQAAGVGDFFESGSSINDPLSVLDRKVTISGVFISEDKDIVNKNEELLSNNTTYVTSLRNESDDIIDSNSNISNITDNRDNDINIEKGKQINDNFNINNEPVGTFQKIRDKKFQNGLITYTPYELYKRLTFLQQCVRQGKTQQSEGISNAVFGKPPVIVFRLGDMYNTKAIITNLGISFENELPWDLNPEGFGVQKMGCKITLNMSLIGGSSIDKPIDHILNADSRRFYANSSFEGNNLDNEENI